MTSSSKYLYTQTTWQALEAALSNERLALYRSYTSSDEEALELHNWNTKLGASLAQPIQGLELLLRNSCNKELETIYGKPDWFNYFPDPLIPINKRFKYLVDETKLAKSRLRNPNNPPCVVAGLTFGYWFALFSKRHERDFWLKGLLKVFKHRPPKRDRAEIADALKKIKDLRNRIAHHEPIFHRNLIKAHALIIDLASCICPETANWINFHSEFSSVFTTCPIVDPSKIAQVEALRLADTQWYL